MIYAASCIGEGKKECEDSILVGSRLLSDTCQVLPVPSEGFICVADGVGGNKGGKAASSFVLGAVSTATPEFDGLAASIGTINVGLIEQSKKSPQLSGMATTLTGICKKDEAFVLVHIGNSRAYVLQGRYLKQITPDHTTYSWLKSMGRLAEAEACNRSEIVSCLGGGDIQLAHKLYIQAVSSFGTMLLTTDGIHDYVSIDALEAILSTNDGGAEKCSAIIQAAKHADSPDDLSVVLICLHED